MSEHCTCATSDVCQVHDEIERLRAALAEAERDAARYRWLRNETAIADRPLASVVWKRKMDRGSSEWVNTASPESLDAAIDAALEPKP